MDHPVVELVLAHLLADDLDFLLWKSDWLAASGTNVTAHGRLRLKPQSRSMLNLGESVA